VAHQWAVEAWTLVAVVAEVAEVARDGPEVTCQKHKIIKGYSL